MSKLPVVAIVGRANVGKSSLFNKMYGSREAIVADVAGTTRDNVTRIIEHNKSAFWLVDTAGLKNPEDEFEASIQDQITEATEAADIILVTVEANTQVTEEDRRVAKMALKSQKPTILVMNKSDKAHKQDLSHWEKTGIRDRIATSSVHGDGVKELMNSITEQFPKYKKPTAVNTTTVAFVGRPNVGKSKLFNTLANKQQAIVADVAGTTRDVNEVTVKSHGDDVVLLDTAGIRRSGKIGKGVEHFSVLRTLQAIEQADVCCLLMDVNELNTALDQKIAGMVREAGKGLIIIVSKWDSVESDAYLRDRLAKEIAMHFQYVWWAPLLFTSSVTGKNVTKIFDMITDIKDNAQIEITTSALNRWLGASVIKHPPAGLKNKHPKLRYGTQTAKQPPTFTIFGEHTEYLHWSYKRYLEREFRETWKVDGTPIRLVFRENQKDRS